MKKTNLNNVSLFNNLVFNSMYKDH